MWGRVTSVCMTESEGLRDLDLPLLVETSDVNFVEDFYDPALSVASEYKRGVGYFTSNWFEQASSGINRLAENEGTAKWIISPKLEQEDWEALEKGERARRDDDLYTELDGLVDDLAEGLNNDVKNTIAWMIADGLLEIKIALPSGDLSGDFHDKWGIIVDEHGNRIAFHGSQNDSEQAFSNYESYSVFMSWESERESQRIEMHEDRFDDIWEGVKSGVTSLSLPDSIALDIVELRDSERPYPDPPEKNKLQSAFRWRHQEVAVDRFFEEESGILDMATGTGKTRTSLKIMDRLVENSEISSIVVATYGNDLLDQWYDTLVNHFDPTIPIYRQYGGSKEMGSFLIKQRNKLEVLIISYDELSELIDKDSSNKTDGTLFIADEVHNLGSEQRREDLKGKLDAFPYRLGLSATPLDPYDETRNEFLLSEVGPIVYEFGLKDAIRRGILCELEYEPLFYELSEEDKQAQKDAFGRYRAMKEENPTLPKSRLYIMLARIRKKSEEKLPVFKQYLEKNSEVLDDALIFVETMEYGKKVQEIIHKYSKEYRTYYGVDDEQNLVDFSEGKISTLVTSRAISEGIDIKSVSNIILFTSDRSRRNTIQRIGRALRTDPNNPGKMATIVDFVVESDVEASTEDDDDPPDKDRYEWLQSLTEVNKEAI